MSPLLWFGLFISCWAVFPTGLMDVRLFPNSQCRSKGLREGLERCEGHTEEHGSSRCSTKKKNIFFSLTSPSPSPSPSHALSTVHVYAHPAPINPFLRSSLCEFDPKDQVSIAIYITMKVSFTKKKKEKKKEREYQSFVVCGKNVVCFGWEWVKGKKGKVTYSRRSSRTPLRHRSGLGS